MATSLYSALITAGAENMAVSDPHGWTLTLISVCVVFAALIILYFLYSLSGSIFSGKFKRRSGRKAGIPDPQTAAAIALALSQESSNGTEAAIATALHLYLGESAHDHESFIITIQNQDNNWKFSKR